MLLLRLPHPYSHLLRFLRLRQPGTPLFPYTTLFRSDSDPRTATFARQKLLEAPVEDVLPHLKHAVTDADPRSEEHTSELQSRENLVCRLLLAKKNVECGRAIAVKKPGSTIRKQLVIA